MIFFSYIRACGNNDGKLPLSISSFKNEFAIFFRSSLKDNFKGLHCRYKVIPEPLGKKKAFEKYDQFDKLAPPYVPKNFHQMSILNYIVRS